MPIIYNLNCIQNKVGFLFVSNRDTTKVQRYKIKSCHIYLNKDHDQNVCFLLECVKLLVLAANLLLNLLLQRMKKEKRIQEKEFHIVNVVE